MIVRSASSRAQKLTTGFPDDAIWFDERGLCLSGLHPMPHPSVDEGSGRLELSLAVAFRRRLPGHVLANVVKAAEDSRRGDHALANIRLALAGLSRVPDARDLPVRTALAEALLAKGMTTASLLEALDRPRDQAATKLDSDQPRVPAGSGRESGRWTRDGEAAGTQSATSVPLAIAASRGTSLFAAELPATLLSGLGALAATLGAAAAVGGVLFVPWQKDVTSSGPLPGDSDHTFTYDSDEGLLQIRDASGNVVAAGHADRLGIFRDANTGVPFGRQIGGTLVFDGAQMTAAQDSDEAAAASLVEAGTDGDEPKLCPHPIPDKKGSEAASPRAQAYQEQISRMINPQRPLPFGLAMGLINPLTGDLVYYDECAEQTGTMVDAKGPGFNRLLDYPPSEANIKKKWLSQSLREVQAAGSRDVEWYFAEQGAADYARELFADEDKGRENITIKVQPAEWP